MIVKPYSVLNAFLLIFDPPQLNTGQQRINYRVWFHYSCSEISGTGLPQRLMEGAVRKVLRFILPSASQGVGGIVLL